MKKTLVIWGAVSLSIFVAMTIVLAAIIWRSLQANLVPDNISQGVAIHQDGLPALQVELAKTIEAAPAKALNQSGLAGAMGGTHVKVTSSGAQEILLPIPQLADGQVPICFFISSTPPDAVTEFRLRKREDCNVVVSARPLAPFEPTDEAVRTAAAAWSRYLESGTLSPGQLKAASAKTAAEFGEFVRMGK